MKTIIKYFAKRTHNIRLQLLCGTLYGLLDLYGFVGTFAILNKARKMQTVKRPNKQTNIQTVKRTNV